MEGFKKSTSDIKEGENRDLGDNYYNEFTQQASYIAVGGIIATIDKVVKNELKNAFCVIRPPGHHAGK